jgi:hypothetical protein
MVHAVYTRHASSSAVARMAKRWVSSHLQSGMVLFEVVELLVAKVYSNNLKAIRLSFGCTLE